MERQTDTGSTYRSSTNARTTNRSSLLGSAPTLKSLQRAGASAGGDDKHVNQVTGLFFWYHFRRLFPLMSTLVFIIAFFVPLGDVNNNIDKFLLSGGILSAITLVFVFVSYRHISPWRRHPSSLILQRAVSSFVFSIVMIIYPWYNISKGNESENTSVFDRTHHDNSETWSDICRLISFVTQAVLFSGELWVFILSLDLYVSLTNPFSSYKLNLNRYQFFAFISTVAISSVLVVQGTCQGPIFNDGICWIKIDNVLSPCIWGFFFIWCSLFYLSSIAVVAFAFTRLRSGLETTYETRKACVSDSRDVIFSYISYGACLALLIIISSTNRSNSSNSSNSSSVSPSESLLAFAISARGFVDGLVWFYLHDFRKDSSSHYWVDRFTDRINYPFEWIQSLVCCNKNTNTSDGTEKKENPLAPYASNTLESPLWGLKERGSFISDADSKSNREETMSHRDTIIANSEEDSVDIDLSPQLNMALRAELLHYVTYGIFESVKRAEDRETEHKRRVQQQAEILTQRFNNRTRTESAVSADQSPPPIPNKSFPDEREAKPVASCITSTISTNVTTHNNTTTTNANNNNNNNNNNSNNNNVHYPNQYGSSLLRSQLSWTPSQTESFKHRHGVQSYTSNTSSFRSSVSAVIRFASEVIGIHQETIGIEEVQPAEDSFTMEEKYLFTDFCPGQFRELRQLCGIAEDWYLDQISQPTKEIIQEGASGAFMFFCGQGDLIVKTVERTESLSLQNILQPYIEHIRNNPDSLLVRFLGLHSLKIYSTEFIFVVMKNIFPSEQIINERFDIKGSWVNRNAKPYPPGKQTTCRYCSELFAVGSQSKCPEIVGPHEANIIFKDNDLISKIRLQMDDAYHVIDILNKDSDALYNMGIMDYSLLIGVKNQQYDVNAVQNAAVGGSNAAFRLSMSRRPSMSMSMSMSHHPSMSQQQNYNNNNNSTAAGTTTNNNNNNNINAFNTMQQVPDKTSRVFDDGYLARAVVAPVAYHFGVIDILQTWSLQKRLERLIKVYILGKPEEGLSCMAPYGYKQRFQRKISQIIEHSIFVREITGSWFGKREVSEPTTILKPNDDMGLRDSMTVNTTLRDSEVGTRDRMSIAFIPNEIGRDRMGSAYTTNHGQHIINNPISNNL